MAERAVPAVESEPEKLDDQECSLFSCYKDLCKFLRRSKQLHTEKSRWGSCDIGQPITYCYDCDMIMCGAHQLTHKRQKNGKSHQIVHLNLHHSSESINYATTGGERTVVLEVTTEQNEKFTGKLEVRAKLVHIKSKAEEQCFVKQEIGQYSISFRPMGRGAYEFQITVNRHPLPPYPVAVIPPPRGLGKPKREIADLQRPRSAAINSKGQIVIIESNSVSLLTPRGERIQTFGTKGSRHKEFDNPYGVTVDNDNNIYVVDYNNHRVQKFNSKGDFMAAVGSKGDGQLQFNIPFGISYNSRDNNLYVGDSSNHRIKVLSTNLSFIRHIGTLGSREKQLSNPKCVAFDSDNNIYVADLGNNRVAVFSARGQFLRAFSAKATFDQKLHSPMVIAIDSANTVYVSENKLHCVSVFSSQGDYITTFGSEGSKEGEFKSIYGLWIDHNDSIIVSDSTNNRLQIF